MLRVSVKLKFLDYNNKKSHLKVADISRSRVEDVNFLLSAKEERGQTGYPVGAGFGNQADSAVPHTSSVYSGSLVFLPG